MRRRPLIYLGIILLLMLLLAWVFTDIFIYVLIAIILSAILRPMTRYLRRVQLFKLRIPRFLAILISFTVFVLVISLFVVLFIPLISDQVTLIRSFNYDNFYEQVTTPLANFENFLIRNDLTTEPPGFMVNTLRERIITFFSSIQVGEMLNQVLSLTGSLLVGILAVLFITFFFLYEMGAMRKHVISLIPNHYFEVTIAAFNKIERLLSNYLTGLLLQMLAIFTIASIGLSIMGIKYAVTIALFAAVANLIPYMGPILGALFGIIVGISTSIGVMGSGELLWLVLKVASVFALVQLIDNVLLQPLIFSKSVKAHPLEIFIVIFAGASLAQIPGMILAIPAYTVIRVMVGELYSGYRSYRVFRIQKN